LEKADPTTIEFDPFGNEFLRGESTVSRVVHGFVVMVAATALSVKLAAGPAVFGKAGIGANALVSFPGAAVAAMALNFAELYRTVHGIGTPGLLEVFVDTMLCEEPLDKVVVAEGLDEGLSLKIPLEFDRIDAVLEENVVVVGDAVLLRRNSLGGGKGTLSSSAGMEFSITAGFEKSSESDADGLGMST
jgi:hypothetical protein